MSPEVAYDYSLNHNSNTASDIFWFGNSFLLRRVVSTLSTNYSFVAPLLPKLQLPDIVSGILIHDGEVPMAFRGRFGMDFNIHHYGERPDVIAENLWNRLSSGLV